MTILAWGGTGLVLICERLDRGAFAWPQVRDGVVRISQARYEAPFEGLDRGRVMARRPPAPAAAG